ncbi:hypothetical protein A0H81_00742 [Grifola frondosa]|uniref:Uncharacterized protein n=1 Tax=Grifola frondosa TaxID=5627 RepID=A0A1C7MNS5_GRIFR|nr:hypothetical protein A0H81_00742 [Grifola frondosa]
MEPLLSKSPLSPVYPPSTPMFPLHSASVQSITSDNTDGDEFFDSPATMDRDSRFDFTQEDEDTITPARAPYLARSITEPAVSQAMEVPSPGLSRTRTTPNRTYYDKNRPSSKSPQTPADDGPAFPQPSSSRGGQDGIDREVRRMKSAGELRRNRTTNPPQLPSKSLASSPQRAALSEYHPSASSSNLLNMGSNSVDQSAPKRFASLGVAAGGMMSNSGKAGRTMGTSLWDNPTEEDAHDVPPYQRKLLPHTRSTLGVTMVATRQG